MSADRELFATALLRRSFGILPADRGVVSRGAHRFARQPMYLDYFLSDIGFLLVNFGIQNIICRRALPRVPEPGAVPDDSLRILTVYG